MAFSETTIEERRRGTRPAAVVAALMLLVAGQVLAGPAAGAADCPAPVRTVLDTTPATADRTVALTFDDGPLPQNTPQVLDLLQSRGVKATFFVTGSNVSRHPDLARRIVAEGHAIGNHTWSHPDLSQLSAADRVAEIDRTTQAITDVTGTSPCFFRGPYGIHRSASIAGLAWERDMTVAHWSLDTMDWATPSGWSPWFQQQIVARATAPGGAHPIVLMHDGGGDRQNTIAALDEIISYYDSRGQIFVDPAGAALPRDPDTGGAPSVAYVVQPGDTLSSIGARYGVGWREIYAANQATIGPDQGSIRAGQRLTIPGTGGGGGTVTPPDGGGSTTYTVQAGDTLSSIGSRNGVGWQEIYAANQATIGPDPGRLRIGLPLNVPAG